MPACGQLLVRPRVRTPLGVACRYSSARFQRHQHASTGCQLHSGLVMLHGRQLRRQHARLSKPNLVGLQTHHWHHHVACSSLRADGSGSTAGGSSSVDSSSSSDGSISMTTTLVDEMKSMAPADLASTLWAYNLSQRYDPYTYSCAVQAVGDSLHSWEPALLVNVLCALAEAGHDDPGFFSASAAVLQGKLDQLEPEALSNLVWCFAQLRLADEEDLLDAAGERALRQVSGFAPHELVKLIAGLAELQQPVLPLLEAADSQFNTWLMLSQISANYVAQLVWSCASGGYYQQQLLDVSAALLIKDAGSLSAEAVTNAVWAYTQLRSADEKHRAVFDVPLFEALAKAARLRLPEFSLHQLSLMLTSLSTTPNYDAALYTEAAQQLTKRLLNPSGAADLATPSELVMFAWSFSRVEHAAPQMMAALGDVCLQCFEDLDVEDLMYLTHAYANTGAYHDSLLRAIVSSALSVPEQWGATPLMELARALPAIQHHDHEFFSMGQTQLLRAINKLYLSTELSEMSEHCGATDECGLHK